MVESLFGIIHDYETDLAVSISDADPEVAGTDSIHLALVEPQLMDLLGASYIHKCENLRAMPSHVTTLAPPVGLRYVKVDTKERQQNSHDTADTRNR